jgi:UDP-4-amino-4,6-dideoxy-N-acetyl-beta-L-altrosamine transaminase
MIPYGRQSISPDDLAAVTEILKSDWLTQGPVIGQFETELTRYCGARAAVAASNATAALHLACLALDLGPGDTLWTCANTFVASANCARYCGAEVDFVDIDARTYNMSYDALTAKLQHAEAAGRLPKIVMPVHFAGQSCQMREIKRLSERYGFRIIEDASHAIGADYLAEPVGSCRYSDICIFSFHPVKIITTGEGGAALTNDATLAQRMRSLRSHGVTRDPDSWNGAGDGDWYYEQQQLGFNYRMTDIQAALGCSQMKRLRAFVGRRRQIAAQYDAALDHALLVRPWQHADTASCYHLYPVRITAQDERRNRRTVFEGMRRAGIGVNVHYIPVCTQPYYRALGFGPGYCPAAEAYYAEAISLPIFPDLTATDQRYVITELLKLLA